MGAHMCAVSGAEPGTEHRMPPNPPHKPVRGILLIISETGKRKQKDQEAS